MPKGIFSQGVCVLLERPVTIDTVEAALAEFDRRGRHDPGTDWTFGGPAVSLHYRPEVNGVALVDVVDRPWPDTMGDPKTDATVFGAWSMGQFGPFAFPGGLARAVQQCWGWEPGRDVPERHRAFLRVRLSYVFGAGGDAPVLPADYQPLPELEFVTDVAAALLTLPEALCYFNPNGEVLRDAATLRECLDYAHKHGLPTLDLWSNVRLFNIGDGWSLMDTVGSAQLDLPDVEACFRPEAYDCGEVDHYLRNVSLYLLRRGEVIADGDTLDGPGGVRWRARRHENGLTDPPRRVLRLVPEDGTIMPMAVT